MKKPAWLIATALIVAMSFTACGPKNTDTVSKDDNTWSRLLADSFIVSQIPF